MSSSIQLIVDKIILFQSQNFVVFVLNRLRRHPFHGALTKGGQMSYHDASETDSCMIELGQRPLVRGLLERYDRLQLFKPEQALRTEDVPRLSREDRKFVRNEICPFIPTLGNPDSWGLGIGLQL